MIAGLVRARIFANCLGMVDKIRPWRLNPDALAEMLNVRVADLEIATTKGRTKENSSALQGGTAVQGEGWGVRADGSEDLIVAEGGGYWKLVGNVKTLLSVQPWTGIAAVTSITGTTVAFDTTGNSLTANCTVGVDKLYMTADGVAAAVVVASIDCTAGTGTFAAAYTGTATTGACDVWRVQTDARTRIKKWLNRWYFANGTDKPTQWDPTESEFRPVGYGTPTAPGAPVSSTAGSLDVTAFYSYKFCAEWGTDVRYSNPCTAVACQAPTAGGETFTWPKVAAYIKKWRVYRTEGKSTSAAAASADHCYLTSVPVSAGATWTDQSADSALTVTETPPTDNDQPPSGVQDFEIHNDRVFWCVGPRVYPGGLSPDDTHSSRTGRWEPEYCPAARYLYVGRDKEDAAPIQGIFRLRKRLWFVRSRSLWMLNDQSDMPDCWAPREMDPNCGSESRWSVGCDGDAAFWVGRKAGRLGVIAFDGGQADRMDHLDATYKGFTETALSAAAGGIVDGRYYLSIDTTAGRQTYEWETNRGDGQGAWSYHDWSAYSFVQGKDRGYAGSSDGFVYQMEQGLSEAGAAIGRRIRTVALRMDNGEPRIPHVERMWKLYRYLQGEVFTVSGFAALSGYYRADVSGSWVAISGLPVSATAGQVKRFAMDLAPEIRARGLELLFTSSGTAEDWTFGDMYLAAQVDPTQEVD